MDKSLARGYTRELARNYAKGNLDRNIFTPAYRAMQCSYDDRHQRRAIKKEIRRCIQMAAHTKPRLGEIFRENSKNTGGIEFNASYILSTKGDVSDFGESFEENMFSMASLLMVDDKERTAIVYSGGTTHVSSHTVQRMLERSDVAPTDAIKAIERIIRIGSLSNLFQNYNDELNNLLPAPGGAVITSFAWDILSHQRVHKCMAAQNSQYFHVDTDSAAKMPALTQRTRTYYPREWLNDEQKNAVDHIDQFFTKRGFYFTDTLIARQSVEEDVRSFERFDPDEEKEMKMMFEAATKAAVLSQTNREKLAAYKAKL